MCDVVIVVALTQTDAKSPAHGIILFLVEAGMPGFKKGRKLEKIGNKTAVSYEALLLHVGTYGSGHSCQHSI